MDDPGGGRGAAPCHRRAWDGQRVAHRSARTAAASRSHRVALAIPRYILWTPTAPGAELLTPFAFGDQYYRSNPDWSPDGRSVAFQSQIAGQFQIMTISLRDRGVKQHTSESTNEDPVVGA